MERKRSNRRMAGEIRKIKYQSKRNHKLIHIYINMYVHTHTHIHMHKHTHKHKCKVSYLITESGPHSSQMCRNIRYSKFLHFGIPNFWDVTLHHWLHASWRSFGTSRTSHPVNMASNPSTPLCKPQNPLVFHLHLTLIEYIRIGEQMAQCNVVFVVVSS
jgi:hypothetical protein